MTTMQIPAWAKEYDVISSDEAETTVNAEFEELLSKSTTGSFIEGEVYKGKIIFITDDFVTVDIGYKQEGLVSRREFQNYDGTLFRKA